MYICCFYIHYIMIYIEIILLPGWLRIQIMKEQWLMLYCLMNHRDNTCVQIYKFYLTKFFLLWSIKPHKIEVLFIYGNIVFKGIKTKFSTILSLRKTCNCNRHFVMLIVTVIFYILSLIMDTWICILSLLKLIHLFIHVFCVFIIQS